jgi:hypothetical protein
MAGGKYALLNATYFPETICHPTRGVLNLLDISLSNDIESRVKGKWKPAVITYCLKSPKFQICYELSRAVCTVLWQIFGHVPAAANFHQLRQPAAPQVNFRH